MFNIIPNVPILEPSAVAASCMCDTGALGNEDEVGAIMDRTVVGVAGNVLRSHSIVSQMYLT